MLKAAKLSRIHRVRRLTDVKFSEPANTYERVSRAAGDPARLKRLYKQMHR